MLGTPGPRGRPGAAGTAGATGATGASYLTLLPGATPVKADYTETTATGHTLTSADLANGLGLTALVASATASWRATRGTAQGTDTGWVLCRMLVHAGAVTPAQPFAGVGLCLERADGKLLTMSLTSYNGLLMLRALPWTDRDTVGVTRWTRYLGSAGDVWLRMRVSGANVVESVSIDGGTTTLFEVTTAEATAYGGLGTTTRAGWGITTGGNGELASGVYARRVTP